MSYLPVWAVNPVFTGECPYPLTNRNRGDAQHPRTSPWFDIDLFFMVVSYQPIINNEPKPISSSSQLLNHSLIITKYPFKESDAV